MISMAGGLASGGGALSILGPLAIPFFAGAALQSNQKKIDERNLKIDAGIAASDNDDNRGFNNPDGTGGYTGGFDSSTGNYSDPYDPGYAD